MFLRTPRRIRRSSSSIASRSSVRWTTARRSTPATEQQLLNVDQPEGNHNGGNIAFGPDGLLYIGIGDGGGGATRTATIGNGQRRTTMLGKMLRIDVGDRAPRRRTRFRPVRTAIRSRRTRGDTCPPDGRASGNCPEIYAYGFRNPWRWSFDRVNSELWVADVGQGAGK